MATEQGAKCVTAAAYIDRDIYGHPVWLVLTQAVDGKERITLSPGYTTWAIIPASRREDAGALHAETVRRFGPAPESASKPLPRRAAIEAFTVLEERILAVLGGKA